MIHFGSQVSSEIMLTHVKSNFIITRIAEEDPEEKRDMGKEKKRSFAFLSLGFGLSCIEAYLDELDVTLP